MASRARVIARRQVDAVMDHLFQDLAVQRVAVDAALRVRRNSERHENKQSEETVERGMTRMQSVYS